MFTGLISAIGEVTGVTPSEAALALDISSPYEDLEPGESVAVDGACLTVVRVDRSSFTVQVVATSVGRTLFGDIEVGSRVNLERALRVGDRLGGHMVQGHVDGVGEVVAVSRQDDAVLVDIAVPHEIGLMAIPLGSVAVNGVSLTVNALPSPSCVQISLIPITLERTTLGSLRPGDGVHLEGDVIGKFVAHLLTPWRQEPGDANSDTSDQQPLRSGLESDS